MKHITILFLLILCTAFAKAQSIEGLWNTGKENTIIKIQKADQQFAGIIHSSDNSNAPIGTPLMKDMVEKGDYYKGKIYVIRMKKWFDAEFRRSGETMLVKVYTGIKTNTVEWKLVK
jgi:uncharacterized protein (DUF2147 family)